MITTVDSGFMVLATFDDHIQLWRGGVFDSAPQAEEEWKHFERGETDIAVEFLRVVQVSVRSDGVCECVREPVRCGSTKEN